MARPRDDDRDDAAQACFSIAQEESSMRKNLVAAVALAIVGTVSEPAVAQDAFPSRPVRILVPFSAGSLVDVIARLYAEKLSPRLGQPVVVENRVGSGGIVASQAMLNAPADGYTLQMVSSSHAINPTLYAKLPYDTVRDVACVALVASSPSVIVTRPDLNVRTVQDLVALARQKPGGLNYGSGGIGTAAHLAGEYFRSQTQTDMVHIPYKGVQEAVAEIMGGRIELAFPPVGLALPQIKAGKIVGLAVTSAERSPLLPDVPTAQEAGLKGFEYGIWYALVAPKKTPAAVMDRVASEMKAVGAMVEIREKLVSQGIVPKDAVLGDCDRFVNAQIAELGQLVKASGAKAE